MKHKLFYKLFILFAFLFITLDSFAESFKQYNVYLIPDTTADKYVKEFDKSLTETNVLEKYRTTPFIKKHPVHLTLYLTSFQSKYLNDIEIQLADLAKNTEPFYIETTGFSAGKSGFVMLDIKNSQSLQRLSNSAISNLAKYRDKDYPAPSWVKFYPSKLVSFEKYGSPNAFAEFNPHISILAANLQTDQERDSFDKDFNEIIKDTKLKPISFKIKAIGFGEVDENGQVTKTLHIYKLNK
ncbi:2'-5' RNA ligase family protein [Francisella philomiragia]|uniref:2'-5' RNA ligase family protein n=1 Tax=Francisella philomiragia TaxID=28110 RepID=UPI001903E690|nr:2'-5' RNA ligase family protein [Francisella philomiragia]MBK2093642.1 2'-5' RNA ligase family protein [Francisella philomiragia]MBK2256112.1 2'-5' RNA ligase family protein [Francisella philomiragia]MBK2268770.1 2'-5' RNA ligase family protein [Francisella philomiragia]MBK2270755.1 2'-5' RNA ligase family protein [Francisella philomiragia]MBK2274535.1 2'-5' RNA ligase family protein [Francisella philomiragia]